MIPCWTAPIVPVEEPTTNPLDVVAEIVRLTAIIEMLDLKLSNFMSSQRSLNDRAERRLDKLEKRHTGHLHWTNMGR